MLPWQPLFESGSESIDIREYQDWKLDVIAHNGTHHCVPLLYRV